MRLKEKQAKRKNPTAGIGQVHVAPCRVWGLAGANRLEGEHGASARTKYLRAGGGGDGPADMYK
jgi:hypothetical protein